MTRPMRPRLRTDAGWHADAAVRPTPPTRTPVAPLTQAPPAQPAPPGQRPTAHPRPAAQTPPAQSPPVHGERYDGVPQADAPLAPGTGPAGRSTPVPQQRPVTPSAEEHPVEPSAEEGGTWTLVKRCQAGDLAAFSELYEKYHEVVYRYVLFRMGDRTLAEDLTQETFVRALRRIGSVSYQGRDIGAWFVTIARNLIFDHVKSSRYRLESTTSEIADYSPTTQGPEQQVLENATNDELRIAIAKLNPDQQECIRMRFLQGLSVAETAERMQRNEGAVKALQHRAVRRLATLLPDGVR
jgi:RNA polymerase sigma-70 factor (ECF subfamily)